MTVGMDADKQGKSIKMARIGLLEDNIRISRLCTTMLQHAGHQVIVYGHPRACLDELLSPPSLAVSQKSLSKKYAQLDALIIDLNLPDISGLEVVNHLVSHPQTRSLPFIFCSAASITEVEQALKLTGRACCIGKPFTYPELISAVAKMIALPTG
jgi:CheY-like chemotaxis protein